MTADTWEARMAERAHQRLELERLTRERREQQQRTAEEAADLAEQQAAQEAARAAGPPHGCEICWEWSDAPDHWQPHLVYGWTHIEPARAREREDGYYLCACACHDGDLYVGCIIAIA